MTVESNIKDIIQIYGEIIHRRPDLKIHPNRLFQNRHTLADENQDILPFGSAR
jgi:hypothetical protein